MKTVIRAEALSMQCLELQCVENNQENNAEKNNEQKNMHSAIRCALRITFQERETKCT